MSKRLGKITIICPESDGRCEFCGKIDELRPYGPKGENICFDCGMKDEETSKRKMNEYLYDEYSA